MKQTEKQIAAVRSLARSNDARWAAVVARDATQDGAFVYSVASTGVYCRPSCPSRQAKRANVQFHASGAEAKAAGFRACGRCKPDEAHLQSEYVRKVEAACRAIEDAEDLPDLQDLARTAGLSRFHFHRIFKKVAGLTPKAYAAAHRNNRVRAAFASPISITQAIHEAGYHSAGRFYAHAPKILGMTPTELRRGGEGTEITFATASSTLGVVLVAATKVGICAVLMGGTAETLRQELHSRFPKASLKPGDREFQKQLAAVIAYIDAPSGSFSLPLDVRGTAFQHRVWRALRDIPSGDTVSYAELARRIGKPSATRAVASACAANPIAVVVPCHRVIRNDGALSGYRWGIERKARLLEREATLAAKKNSKIRQRKLIP